MLYGLLVGISCIAALLLISAIYSYSILQGKVSALSYSYTTIVKLEAFQRIVSGQVSLSEAALQAASIDKISIKGSGGTFAIGSIGDEKIYAIT